jgi:phosphoribosylformylglycinamidine cyclo-ligase
VFRSLQEWGDVADDEMWHTFNMGIGMVVAVASADAHALHEELEAAGEEVWALGAVVDGDGVRLEAGFEVAG